MKIKIFLVILMLCIGISKSFGQTIKLPSQYEKDVIDKKLTSQNIINTVPAANQNEKSITGSNLIAYYPFNGNANDESGNNINPTYIGSGVTLTSDRFGINDRAFYFDGNDGSYIRVPADSFPTTERTISMWVNVMDLPSYQGRVPFSYGGNECNTTSFLTAINNADNASFWSAGHCSESAISYAYSVSPINTWKHWVITIKGSLQHLYIDGELKATANYTGAAYVSGKSAIIGALIYIDGNTVFADPSAGYFKGKIDDIRIYNVAMTDSEVQNLYNNEANGLVAYYPFNGNANDESGNGHDGAINGKSTLTTDRYMSENKAFTFPDQSSNISLANSTNLNLENGFTINAWVKYKNNNITAVIVCKHVCGFPNGFFFGIDTDGQIQLWLANSAWSTVRTNTTFVENKWYMTTASYDAGTGIAKVYINGELSGSGNVTYTNFSSNPISIGESYNNNCGPGNLSGAIDEVKIYDRPLSDDEISKEYTTSRNSLVAYYPFKGNANDESGNGNHGTITGALVTPAADRYGEEGKAYKFWFPDFVSVPTNSTFFTDEFTVSYWYKVASYWGDRGVLSCVGNKGGYQQVFTAGTTFTYLLGYNFPSGSWFWTNYTVPNTPNTWQHITTTYQKTGDNASASRFYINGELKSSDIYGNSIAYPGSEIFYIGRNHSDLGLNGELDEVRLYSKALSDQEIKDLYLAETKPVLLDPANQSSVKTLTPEMLWSSPLANTEFRFQLSSDSLFGTILHELVTTDLKTQLPETLLAEGQNYFWRVRSTLAGKTGPWSTVWRFDYVVNTGVNKPNKEEVSLRISPNPADASAKIVYSLPETGISQTTVTIEVLNSIGTCTKKLTVKNMVRGNNEVEVETSSLQSGVYYCRLKAGNISIVQKLVIMH